MNQWLTRGLWFGLSLLMAGWLVYEHFWINKMGGRTPNVWDLFRSHYVYQGILAGYFLSHLMIIRSLFDRIERLEVTTMLWRLFLIGMGGVFTMLVIFFVYDGWLVGRVSSFMQGSIQALFFTLGLEAAVIFFLSGLFTFRRFILYQKNKAKVRSWKGLFIFLVIALLLTNRYTVADFIPSPGVYNSLRYTFAILYGCLLIYITTHVRWIGFLNLNQKLRALGLLLLIMAVGGTFVAALIYLPSTLEFNETAQEQLVKFYFEPIFLACVASFTFVYAGGAVLVLFFNLPTSSVFEQKRSEIASFNKINQSIQSNLRKEEVLKTTLEASILSSNAEAGWIDELQEGKAPATILSMQIAEEEVLALSGHYDLATHMIQSRQPALVKNTRRHKAFRASGSIYRSLMGLPVITDNKVQYAIFVVSTLSNAFEEETLATLQAYGAQAGAAIENAALIQNAISLERYQEQLKIAKGVQEDLLPRSLPSGPGIEFAAVSETAEEVGGDYFDIIKKDNDRYQVAIGDVSGKGTKAAFYMAEVKGIFHALGASLSDPVDFVRYANTAVNACFKSGNFVTLTYLSIDANKRQVQMVRAGHCPTMIYRAATKKVEICRKGTLALGMVGTTSFGKHATEVETLEVDSGDLIFLYTDGILETRNAQGESFGYKRLQDVISTEAHLGPDHVSKVVLKTVLDFAQDRLHDDYTILAIGFPHFSKPKTN